MGSIAALATFTAIGFGFPQQHPLKPRWYPIKSLSLSEQPGRNQHIIIVKFNDGFGVTAENGRLMAADSSLAKLLQKNGDQRVEPLFSTPVARLKTLREDAAKLTGEDHADLTQFFKIELPKNIHGHDLLAGLLNRSDVENAYFAPIPVAAPGNVGTPTTPDMNAMQLNLKGLAPMGIEQAFAISDDPAAYAPGVRIADLEYDWDLLHEDLSVKSGVAPSGPPPVTPFTKFSEQFTAKQHGTAVLGLLAADQDSYGVTGIAAQGGIRTVATSTASGVNVASAVLTSLTYLQPGDIILIEQQTPGPNYNTNCTGYSAQNSTKQFGLVPVEYNDAEFAAINMAVALGYTVVEAAGNGGQDLDNLISTGSANCSTGDPSYTKFDLLVRDSGAVVVACGTSSLPHVPTAFTNVGNRIDSFSWGENVVTTGYGDMTGFNDGTVFGNIHKYYTDKFGGTSASAAIVAGCAAILESKHLILFSLPYPPQALRLLLRTRGTDSQDPRNDRIGKQPNLRTQLQAVASVKDPSVVRSGKAGWHLGASVTFSGDTSADSRANLVIGSPDFNSSTGRVDLVNTMTGDNLTVWNGFNPGDKFGLSVARAGDVDGDGVVDTLVSAPGGNGNVYLFSGFNPSAVQTIPGTGGGYFGYSLAGATDIDGDGIPDFIVGTPQGSTPQLPGTLEFHNGTNGQVILQINGGSPTDLLGFSLAIVGDIDNDGYNEIMAGLPGSNNSTGAVNVYNGHSGSLLYHFNGQVLGDLYGTAVAGVGDANGDGIPDLAVGAPMNSLSSPLSGRIYMYSGSNGQILYRKSGSALQRFGSAVCGAGDINRDHYDDLIVGAPGAAADPNNIEDPGHVYVLSGKTGQIVEVYTGEVVGDGFGAAVAGAIDADDNSIADILIGAAYNSTGGAQGGTAYLVLRENHTIFGLAAYGTGTPGCDGPQVVFANSNPFVNNIGYALNCNNAPRNAFGLLAIGDAPDFEGSDPFSMGFLLHIDLFNSVNFYGFGMFSDQSGYAQTLIPIPNDNSLVGESFFAQAYWNWSSELGPGMLCSTLPTVSGWSSSFGLWMTIQAYPN
ncbi:MAG: FG-GAP repeat protein [Planctomycetes bacterium]|nr:FG-GAP repeat protein [Planctomycetota bacterium]